MNSIRLGNYDRVIMFTWPTAAVAFKTYDVSSVLSHVGKKTSEKRSYFGAESAPTDMGGVESAAVEEVADVAIVGWAPQMPSDVPSWAKKCFRKSEHWGNGPSALALAAALSGLVPEAETFYPKWFKMIQKSKSKIVYPLFDLVRSTLLLPQSGRRYEYVWICLIRDNYTYLYIVLCFISLTHIVISVQFQFSARSSKLTPVGDVGRSGLLQLAIPLRLGRTSYGAW